MQDCKFEVESADSAVPCGPVAEVSHEGPAAETAAHHADEEDETAMEGARATSTTSESADSSRAGGTPNGAHTAQSVERGLRTRA